MKFEARILTAIICFLALASLSDIAAQEDSSYFREDFSLKKLSVFRWGVPTFEIFKIKGDPEMVSNRNGINYLRLGPSDGRIYPSGFIYTKERFTYGSYSARIKISGAAGAVGSFFACNEISKIFTDGTHDEIDFEFITAEPHSVLMTTWYVATGMEGDAQTPTHNSFLWKDPSFDIREWHTYRFDWHPDKVDFFIDGIKRWTSARAIPKRELLIALNMYTIDTWKEVQFPPKGEALQITDWVEYKELRTGK